MDIQAFQNSMTGELVPITGVDPVRGPWQHFAFLPTPLTDSAPPLTTEAHLAVADARAALAALDSTAMQLSDPGLFRYPTLRLEAQSTAALEGTYEPLSEVLTAGEDSAQNASMREVLNYIQVANTAFAWVKQDRLWSLVDLEGVQAELMKGTAHESPSSGHVRTTQVVIGRRDGVAATEFPVVAARFVPPPPGLDLEARVRDLTQWMQAEHRGRIDPVIAAAMAHYAFEALHPFHDGNGRLGRLLIVLQLHQSGTLNEPTLSVSPWFEARRAEYYDRLLAVSTSGAWAEWVTFFANGIGSSATQTNQRMRDLIAVQARLRAAVQASPLRAGSALQLVDYAIGHPTFTVKQVAKHLSLTYGRANKLVESLVDLAVLAPWGEQTYNRRFHAPDVLGVLLGQNSMGSSRPRQSSDR